MAVIQGSGTGGTITTGTNRTSTTDSNSTKDSYDKESDGVKLSGGSVGQSRYISWTLASLRNLAQKTIILWIKLDTQTPSRAIFGMIPTGGSDEYFSVNMYSTTSKVSFTAGWTSGGVWATSHDLQIGHRQIIVTYDKSSSSNAPTFYINGDDKSVNTVTAASGSYRSGTGNTVNIGKSNEHTYALDGRVLFVAVYNRILSASEKRSAYDFGSLGAYSWAEKNANGLLFCPNLNMATGIARASFIGATIGASNKFLNYVDGGQGTPSGDLVGIGAS